MSLMLFRSSVPVPKVLLIPGIPGLWCMASAAGTYSTSSTSALATCVILLLVYVERDSRYLLEPSAYRTPSAREDFPEPETPAMPTILFSGISTSTFFRLCTLAPCTSIFSGLPVFTSIRSVLYAGAVDGQTSFLTSSSLSP